MSKHYDEIPIDIWRNGVPMTVPAGAVEVGDEVSLDGKRSPVVDTIDDPDDQTFYFTLNGWAMLPAGGFDHRQEA